MRPAARAAALLYLAAVLHGLVLVSVPALAPLLRSTLALGDTAWGAAFLPQMAGSFVGSILSGVLAPRVGLRSLLVASLVLAGLAQAALLSSAHVGYGGLLGATALAGLAFGVSAAPLNGGPPALFPRHLDASVAATHVAFGIGLCLGPALAALAAFRLPLVLIGLALVLGMAGTTAVLPPANPASRGAGRPSGDPAFWLLLSTLFLYGCAEATFGNWVVVYLAEEKGLSPADAALGLAAFWGAMTAGRAAAIALLWRVPSARVVGVFPALIVAALLVIPQADSRGGAVAAFAGAGLACSAFVPIVLALGVRRFPQDGAAVSAALIAAIGAGLGTGTMLAGLLRDGRTLAHVYQLAIAYPALILGALAVLRRRGDLRED